MYDAAAAARSATHPTPKKRISDTSRRRASSPARVHGVHDVKSTAQELRAHVMDERTAFASTASTSRSFDVEDAGDRLRTTNRFAALRRLVRTPDFWVCFVIGVVATLGVVDRASRASVATAAWDASTTTSTSFGVDDGGVEFASLRARGIEASLGRRKALSVAALAESAHVQVGKSKVVFLTVCTGKKLPQVYDLTASLKDVGVHKFIVGCTDKACLEPLLALDAPVFDASDSEEKFAYKGSESTMPEHASRWARLDAARELLERGYVVVVAAPTVRFRRNPLDVLNSLLKHDAHGPTVFATRGLHSYNITAREAEIWTVPGSLASIKDDFAIFTPGSQSLIRAMFNNIEHAPVPAEVTARFADSAPPGTAEKHWKENPSFVMNWVLNREGGLKWHDRSGAVVDASPFEIKPREVSLDPKFIADGDLVRGDVREVRGKTVGRGGLDAIDVVLLDTTTSRAHCNNVDSAIMRQTYIVACDLDDAALAGRRIEVDSQCMVMKALESSSGAASLGLFRIENRGESPISQSRGYLGALEACRL